MEMNTRTGQAAPRVRLKPNVQKIVAAITYVIARADARRIPVTQYDILKTIFIADSSGEGLRTARFGLEAALLAVATVGTFAWIFGFERHTIAELVVASIAFFGVITARLLKLGK